MIPRIIATDKTKIKKRPEEKKLTGKRQEKASFTEVFNEELSSGQHKKPE